MHDRILEEKENKVTKEVSQEEKIRIVSDLLNRRIVLITPRERFEIYVNKRRTIRHIYLGGGTMEFITLEHAMPPAEMYSVLVSNVGTLECDYANATQPIRKVWDNLNDKSFDYKTAFQYYFEMLKDNNISPLLSCGVI